MRVPYKLGIAYKASGENWWLFKQEHLLEIMHNSLQQEKNRVFNAIYALKTRDDTY